MDIALPRVLLWVLLWALLWALLWPLLWIDVMLARGIWLWHRVWLMVVQRVMRQA